jgi:hypothetical protein
MEEVGIFYGLLSILRPNYIFLPFGTFCDHKWHFFPVLVCCLEKNLATLALIGALDGYSVGGAINCK